MSFGRTCPNCQGKDKVIKKCWNCSIYACKECTINKLCIDCHVKLRSHQELKDYKEDKLRKENLVMADLILE